MVKSKKKKEGKHSEGNKKKNQLYQILNQLTALMHQLILFAKCMICIIIVSYNFQIKTILLMLMKQKKLIKVRGILMLSLS